MLSRRKVIRGLYGGMPEALLAEPDGLQGRGIDAVWLRHGAVTGDAVERLRAAGVQVFAAFSSLHDPAYVESHPEAAPVGVDGAVCPPQAGWQGVCPTHRGYRQSRMDALRELAGAYPLDGVWLDDHHSHVYWTSEQPLLPDTCFCRRCVKRFAAESGEALPTAPAGALGRLLLTDLREPWLAWRLALFADWVREYRQALREARPEALLGSLQCPWTEEYDSAVSTKLAIDRRAQAAHLDVVSPMVLQARLGHGGEVEWVRRRVAAVADDLGLGRDGAAVRLWPVVQVSDWGQLVLADQVADTIAQAAQPPSSGVIAFAWDGLMAQTDKVEALTRAFRELGP